MRRWRRLLIAAAALAGAGAGGGACSIGKGTGEAKGPLHVEACYGLNDDGTPRNLDCGPSNPMCPAFDLGADFFVGEAIDAPSELSANLLLIRVQNAGVRLEFADVVGFYLLDLSEVGRCISGRVDPTTGQPDWDPDLCDRPDGASGSGRIRIGTESETARAFLMLNHTCLVSPICPSCPTLPNIADAVGLCNDGSCPSIELCPGRGSWISFSNLGSLVENSGVKVDRTNRFKVNYGERIRASAFHLELCDSHTIDSVQERIFPVPVPRIVGAFDGRFDFDLERGQAGQPFP